MTLRARLQHAPLLGFFALTFAWSWGCWALSPAIRPQLPWLATLLMFAGSFGPSLAAIVVVASSRSVDGLRTWLSRCLRWRIGWGWWTLALLLPLAVMLLAAGLHIALGGDIATSPASGYLLMTVVNLPLFFIDGTAQAHVPPALFLLSVVAMSVVPVLPTEGSYRAYAFIVATLVVLALVALLTSGPKAGRVALAGPGLVGAKP
jgi:hypothetical protein